MKSLIHPLFNVAQVELIYRNKVKVADRPKVLHSQDAYKLFLSTWDENKIELIECFNIMLLDRQNACIGISEIGKGGVHHCVADPKIIFATALKARACNLILAHNHPSGGLLPSKEDITLSRKVGEGADILGMKLLDHLIITPEQYYSFADEGRLIP